jgi:hypothetical protein
MSTFVRSSLLASSLIGALAVVGHDASANTSSIPGIGFTASIGSQEQYLNVVSYAAETNSASSAVNVVGQIAFSSANAVSLTGAFSSASSCQMVATNGVGNASWVGNWVQATGSALSVQTLPLGTPPAYGGSALVINCTLEPGGYIGLAWQ